jgi:2'-5' RNA ligase
MVNAAGESRHRVFFALWPTESLRAQIVEQTRTLVDTQGGRAIPPSNLHVTLLFLGAIAFPSLTDLVRAASSINASSFDIDFDHVTVWRRSKVLVLGASRTPDALRSLVEGLRISSLQAKAVLDTEDYRPHITLARDVERSRGVLPQVESLQWPAREFVLVESKSGAKGSNYSVIYRWPLA